MAHYKRHYPRTSSRNRGDSRGYWLRHWPRWHDIVFHTRPFRRSESELIRSVLLHGRDPDEIAWPIHWHKPHKYYWVWLIALISATQMTI